MLTVEAVQDTKFYKIDFNDIGHEAHSLFDYYDNYCKSGVLASGWKPKGNDELVQIRDECFKLESVTVEDKLKILKSEYPDNPSVHCYVKCTSIKVGTWDDETGPDIDRTWKQIETSGNTITREELVKCTPPKQDNKCAWAYQGLMCILKSEGVKSDLIKEV